MRARAGWTAILVMTAMLVGGPSFGGPIEICDNGIDDNGNGLIDCLELKCEVADPSCGIGTGCCILFDCVAGPTGTGAGQFNGGPALCFDNTAHSTCATQISQMATSGGAGEEPDGLVCTAGTIVAGPCAAVPACATVLTAPAPLLSAPLLAGVALLLAAVGAMYARRSRPA